MPGSFRHQSSIIQKLLDTDFIDTENTDYSYLQDLNTDEEMVASSEQAENQSSFFGNESDQSDDITFNGVKLSIYRTELMSDSHTAPEST
mmetsp:Transcript_22703/g.26066  ORF Transcript_22703/g.26066 Transcript_22703/m.26066 type:complete len:90 (+) Transcript_22703:464-733(+)|eukprot:CAMPEP_0168329658 /NCGR_PEP_ID=MMETSP0213-20121227/7244_1 /TAXON_ID=151035 /ORGANISM="Euplotes harpa, Strain FSP1.4" /LENGTH=89 /DNA_ID=CAMNT_0008333035 /DNA_START=464 /DNA_END=733 /DNA_ORIENTATION=-